MQDFFKVTPLATVFEYMQQFPTTPAETLPLLQAADRVLAEDIIPEADYPEFNRATMDGYAVKAGDTFGASETNPVYLDLTGAITMGESPPHGLGQGQAMAISTGGMLPEGSDSVVMREYVTPIDAATIEIVRSVAPWANVIAAGEDMAAGEILLPSGTRLRPQECGTLAALGHCRVLVYKKPLIGIISTGDEIVPIEAAPSTAQIRDINTYTLSAMVPRCGGIARPYGIVPDDARQLKNACLEALKDVDMLLISGGSSVGTRDITIEALSALPDAEILVHGIPLSPGKPTILAQSGHMPIWGLPGQVTSAMIVMERVIRPFIEHMAGCREAKGDWEASIPAVLSRNIASTPGRTDYVRARLVADGHGWQAVPITGKSGLINTMLRADGLIEIDMNTEGLEKGAPVNVVLFT